MAVVEGMVVGQGHPIHSEMDEKIDRGWWRPEEEGLVRIRPPFAPFGDATLEVEHEQVGGATNFHQFPGYQGVHRTFGQHRPHSPAQHGVAGEGQPEPALVHAAANTQRPTAIGSAASITVPSPPQ